MRWLDVGGQVLCFVIPLGYWFSVKDKGLDGALSFILIYFSVGAWQLISSIAWLIATPWKKVSVGRKVYLGMLGFLVLALLPSLGSNPGNLIAIVLVGTAVLALFYFVLTVVEARGGRKTNDEAGFEKEKVD